MSNGFYMRKLYAYSLALAAAEPGQVITAQ